MIMSIDTLATNIRKQADRLFPGRTDSSMFLKIYGEVGELITAQTKEEKSLEFADLMILLLDYADIHGIFIEESIMAKMRTNEARTWTRNELGVFQHVKG